MKKIGVIVNTDKDKELNYTRQLVSSIQARGGLPLVASQTAAEIGLKIPELDEDGVLAGSEVIVCLGGDGTFLKAARKIYPTNLPMLGINLGSLGFLTEVDRNDIDNAVGQLLSDKYQVEERMMLEGSVIRKGRTVEREVALNDVVISRGALSRILHVKTYINDTFVDTFPGDGLIISSPTGSTAYSLSAGGPIVEPDTELIVVTPICPHILYSRSVITTGNRTVKAVVDENYIHEAMVTIDGQKGYVLNGGDVVEIRKSSHTIKLIRINSRNFFNVLRSKIYFRGESLRKDEV